MSPQFALPVCVHRIAHTQHLEKGKMLNIEAKQQDRKFIEQIIEQISLTTNESSINATYCIVYLNNQYVVLLN